MSTTTTYVDRLEHELLGAIGRRRRKRTVVTLKAAMIAVTTAVARAGEDPFPVSRSAPIPAVVTAVIAARRVTTVRFRRRRPMAPKSSCSSRSM